MNVLIDGEIVLHGPVGDFYWDPGFTARDVIEALATVGRQTDIKVRINSGGGIALEGVAIYNALLAHGGKVTCEVEGIAASAASIIAMAGDATVMRAGAILMIHDPSMITFGDAGDHTKSRDILDKLGDQMAGIYADKTGSDADAVRDLMREETWMTAEEAVSLGFADSADDDAEAAEATAFDYRMYAHAPEPLTVLAKARSWTRPDNKDATMTKPAAAAKPAKTEPKDATAATPSAADIRAEERARISTIVNSDEAKGRSDLAAHLAHETDMTAEDAVKLLARAPKDVEAKEIKSEDPSATLAGLELAAPPAPAKPQAKAISAGAIYAQRRKAG